MTFYDRFRWAEDLFAHRDYLATVRVLEELFGELAGDPARAATLGDPERPGAVAHGLTDARELLARAYFHSAQLGRAERAARELLEQDPTHGYAALLLARTLRRAARHEEADRAYARAAALGAVDRPVAVDRRDQDAHDHSSDEKAEVTA